MSLCIKQANFLELFPFEGEEEDDDDDVVVVVVTGDEIGGDGGSVGTVAAPDVIFFVILILPLILLFRVVVAAAAATVMLSSLFSDELVSHEQVKADKKQVVLQYEHCLSSSGYISNLCLTDLVTPQSNTRERRLFSVSHILSISL